MTDRDDAAPRKRPAKKPKKQGRGKGAKGAASKAAKSGAPAGKKRPAKTSVKKTKKAGKASAAEAKKPAPKPKASAAAPAPKRGRKPSRSGVKVGSEHLPRNRERGTKVYSTPPPVTLEEGDPPKPGDKKKRLKRVPIRVGGHRVKKGSKENILLKISEHYTHQGVYIPVTVIRGKTAGPRLFLTAAVHGDEVNGVQIIRETIDQIEPSALRGTVVAVPVVNRFGFVSHSRYMPDRRDLNRGFPGDATGSTTARVARIVFDEIVRPCDYGIDLHTAGYQRANLPQIRGDMDNDEVRRIAKAFGAEVLLDNRGLKGTLRRVATEQGVPTIIYEAGETFRFQRDMITKGVVGILNVMRELRMLKGELVRPPYQVIVKTSQWVRADHGGILEILIEPGSLVYKGDVMARIANPFGHMVDEVRAPFDGLAVGTTTLPMVNPGAPICHMVRLKKTLKTVAHHTKRAFPPEETRHLLADYEATDIKGAFEEEDVEG